MQTIKTLAILVLAAALGTGCTLKQDPYADQPDAVKNAGPMDPKPTDGEENKPRYGYLRIQAEDTAELHEGQEAKITIKGMYLSSVSGREPVLGQDYQIAVDNIADFQGATFDAPSGLLKWTPKPGFVDTAYTKNVLIHVTLSTLREPLLVTEKTIVGIITRDGIDPTVESIDDLTSPGTKEGESRDFSVWVLDPHGIPDSPATKPRLAVVADGQGVVSAANLVYCVNSGCKDPEVDPTNPRRYRFNMRLDLRNKEITKSDSATLSVAVIAISRFGETSAEKRANVVIKSKIRNAEVSWSDANSVEVIAGKKNVFTFTVYDPNSEGNLTVNFDTRCDLVLGPTATCTCAAQAQPGTTSQLCTVSWDVPPSPFQTNYDLSFTTYNRSKDFSQLAQLQFSRRLHVVQPANAGPVHPEPTTLSAGGVK